MKEGESKKNRRFLDMALGVALTSKCRFKHGAVVVKHGRVLSASPNVMKNNPKYVNPKYCSIHAEVRALRIARFPKRATVFVARVNNLGEARLSKPCAGCQSLIDELNCKVVFT